MAKLSPKVQAQIDRLQKSGAAARAKVTEMTGTKPARMGIAAAGGAIGGAIHSVSAIDLAGRTIPFSLPIGLALGAFTKDARLEALALGMLGHGAGSMVEAEWRKMGWTGRTPAAAPTAPPKAG